MESSPIQLFGQELDPVRNYGDFKGIEGLGIHVIEEKLESQGSRLWITLN